MSEVALSVFAVAMAVWVGALLRCMLSLRPYREPEEWEPARATMARTGLLGTWAGAVAIVALLWGREGFSQEWAAAVILVAIMITAGLFERAVLLPSLDAAHKRLGQGDDPGRWLIEYRFLRKMSSIGRWGMLFAGLLAFLFGLASGGAFGAW